MILISETLGELFSDALVVVFEAYNINGFTEKNRCFRLYA